MPYNDIIDRGANSAVLQAGDAGALIPEDVSKEIVKGLFEKSAALRLFEHRSMGRAQTRIPVLGSLPTAYFVSGDVGFKQTTDMSWANVYLNAEEIAAIIPIPEKVLDDTDYDLWAEVRPAIEEAIAIALDDAIFFGTNKPTTWPMDIQHAASVVLNEVVAGAGVDYLDDVNSAMAAVEADGFFPNGFFARMPVRAKIRGLRDSQRDFLMNPDGQSNLRNMPIQIGKLFGEDILFSRGGFAAFTTLAAAGNGYSLFTGDFKQAIIGVRQDITVKMLTEGVITTNAVPPVIQFNLPQQDMVAMRVVARFAFAVPNPINRLNTSTPPAGTPQAPGSPIAGNRYPFAVIKQKQSAPFGEG